MKKLTSVCGRCSIEMRAMRFDRWDVGYVVDGRSADGVSCG